MLELGHDYFMRQALKLAEQAFEEDEVPVGAIVVLENKIIGKGYNQTERLNDVTAHAEMLALTAAFQSIGGKWLEDCIMYVTLEPCSMCAGAIQWSRLSRLVYGAHEPKFGFQKHQPPLISESTEIVSGIMAGECGALMKEFFRAKRK